MYPFTENPLTRPYGEPQPELDHGGQRLVAGLRRARPRQNGQSLEVVSGYRVYIGSEVVSGFRVYIGSGFRLYCRVSFRVWGHWPSGLQGSRLRGFLGLSGPWNADVAHHHRALRSTSVGRIHPMGTCAA